MNSRKLQEFKLAYGSTPDAELARRFKLGVRKVGNLAGKHCLRKDKKFAREHELEQAMPRWTDADLRWLRAHYADTSNLGIARHLGRSMKSVASKASRLGLKKSGERLAEMGRENKSRQ